MSQYDLSRPVMERLREAADIVAVVGEHLTLKKVGRNFVGLCPFHGEKTPSFSVSREKGTYYCFGCKRGGDAIDFVMEVERVTFPEAAERLAERFGVELPLASPDSQRRKDEQQVLVEVMEAAQALFIKRIGDDRPRAVLERRGVSAKLAGEFGLGYAPGEWRVLYDALQKRFPERALVTAGLVVEGDQGRLWDRFRDRITIPIRHPRGHVIAFGGRAVGDDNPKYLNSPETPLFSKSTVLFAMDRAQRAFGTANRAIVVEGYFDCIALHDAGFTETVATLGTSLSEHHARDLSRKAPRVIVCYDGDTAGRQAARSALRTLLAAGLDVSVVTLPEGEDPDDVARREGRDAFAERLAHAHSATEFLLQQMGASREERRRHLAQALELVEACADPVRRFAYKEALATGAGIPLDQVEIIRAQRVASEILPDQSFPSPGEAALLRSLLIDLPVDARAAAVRDVPADALDHTVVRTLVTALKDREHRGLPLEISELTSDIEDREARRLLAALEHEVPPTGKERLTLVMRELWEKHRQRRLVELNLSIARAEKNGDHGQLAELLREKSALIRKDGGR